MKTLFKIVLCSILVVFCASMAQATTPSEYRQVRVEVKSLFTGTTVMASVPQPANYGPDVQVNPVDPRHFVVVGSFPVDPTRDIKAWDVVEHGYDSVSADCGKAARGAKAITIFIQGNYPNPHHISCHVVSRF